LDEIGPLANRLRELHVPEGVSGWPPAPGWWLIFGVIVVLALGGVAWWWRKTALRREALGALQEIAVPRKINGSDAAFTAEISILLKRIALARYPRDQVAGLTGEEWLSFLDKGVEDKGFSQGAGQVLATGPYAPDCKVDREQLLRLVGQWIRRVA